MTDSVKEYLIDKIKVYFDDIDDSDIDYWKYSEEQLVVVLRTLERVDV